MYLKKYILAHLLLITIVSCYQSVDIQETITETEPEALYFPSLNSNDWQTISLEELGWDITAEQDLKDFLINNDTYAFIILKDGRIAIEWYLNGFTKNDIWYWASAGKTLSAFTLGIAQEEGFLNLNDPSSDYLGEGWSSLTTEQESNITVLNHITMTTGLDYTNSSNLFCTDWDCLTYLNESGTFWYYHNAPYTLTQSIITGAVGLSFDDYFNEKLKSKIGMTGFWFQNGYNNIYRSDARSMARFGLLNLNKGKWNNDIILSDANYFEAMTTTSQNLNKAYGYLWWLNGKESYRLPSSTQIFNGKLIPNAPNDLIAGLGANDQKLHVVPSQNLVIVRLGESAGQAQLGPSGFDNMLWEKINGLID